MMKIHPGPSGNTNISYVLLAIPDRTVSTTVPVFSSGTCTRTSPSSSSWWDGITCTSNGAACNSEQLPWISETTTARYFAVVSLTASAVTQSPLNSKDEFGTTTSPWSNRTST